MKNLYRLFVLWSLYTVNSLREQVLTMNYCVIKLCPPNLTVLVSVCSTWGGVLVGLPSSGFSIDGKHISTVSPQIAFTWSVERESIIRICPLMIVWSLAHWNLPVLRFRLYFYWTPRWYIGKCHGLLFKSSRVRIPGLRTTFPLVKRFNSHLSLRYLF